MVKRKPKLRDVTRGYTYVTYSRFYAVVDKDLRFIGFVEVLRKQQLVLPDDLTPYGNPIRLLDVVKND